MAATTGIGVVGAKFAGGFHTALWKTIEGADVRAVADIDDAGRQQFQKQHGISKGYGDYRSLIEDPEIDLVDVCLPNFLHVEASTAALQAGKHVICEKPMATTLSDAVRLVECWETSGRKFFYAEDWIFAPALVRIKQILAEGGIGKPLYFKGKECHNGSHSPFAQTVRYCGGGSLIHLGIHSVGFFHHLLGMPESVIGKCTGGGQGNLMHKGLEGEDWALGVLSYADGTQAVVEGNYITRGGMDDVIEVYGEEGVIKVDLTLGSPIAVYSAKGYSYAVEKTDFTQGWTRPAVDENQSLGYRDELTHFLGCVRGDSEQMSGTTARDGLRVFEIVDALYRSNREGRRIELG